MLRFKSLGRSISSIQVQTYAQTQVHNTRCRRRNQRCAVKVETKQSTFFLGDFNVHVGNDARGWTWMSDQHCDTDINAQGKVFMQLCCHYVLCIIMKTFYRILHKRSSPEGLTEKTGRGCWSRHFQKEYHPSSECSQYALGTRKGIGSCLKQLELYLLRGNVDGNESVFRIRRKRIRVANRGKQVTPAATRR